MKQTASRNKASKSVSRARMRKRRRKRIRNTILLLVLMAALACGGGFLLYTLKDGMLKPPYRHSALTENLRIH